MLNSGCRELEASIPGHFITVHTEDSNFQWHYAQLKDIAESMYLWGLRTDNDDAVDFYVELHKLYRKYDSKFLKPAKDNSHASETAAEATDDSPVS